MFSLQTRYRAVEKNLAESPDIVTGSKWAVPVSI